MCCSGFVYRQLIPHNHRQILEQPEEAGSESFAGLFDTVSDASDAVGRQCMSLA